MIRNMMGNTSTCYRIINANMHTYRFIKCFIFHNVLSAHVNIVKRKDLFIMKHLVPKEANNRFKD